ncbi:MAG: hypothetical protein M0R06_06955, partial [Sphaerochaeta sp.]|nr:hypothetical protein [Sphaerochaeta sp.]
MDVIFKEGTPSKATVAATSTEVLAAKSGRLYARLTNDSDETIYLSIGTPAVMNEGLRLNANGGLQELGVDLIATGAVYAICASGG